MTTSPVPRLQADVMDAEAMLARAHAHGTPAQISDAEMLLHVAISSRNAAVAAEIEELRAEKAADRRRDAEADRADAVAELREAIR